METRTVWVVNYRNSAGTMRKAEYLCLTDKKAEELFWNDNKYCTGYEIVSILDWRDDMKNERRKSR